MSADLETSLVKARIIQHKDNLPSLETPDRTSL